MGEQTAMPLPTRKQPQGVQRGLGRVGFSPSSVAANPPDTMEFNGSRTEGGPNPSPIGSTDQVHGWRSLGQKTKKFGTLQKSADVVGQSKILEGRIGRPNSIFPFVRLLLVATSDP